MKDEEKILLFLAIAVVLIFNKDTVADAVETVVKTVTTGYRKTVAQKVVTEWKDLAEQYSGYWSVDPQVILAIICQESGGNPAAQNPADPSKGLMQLTPGALSDFNRSVGRSYTFDDMLQPELNIEAGTWYYSSRLARTNDQHKALAAYNAGLGNIPAGEAYATSVETYLDLVKEQYASL